MPPLLLRLFGPPRLERGDAVVEIRRSKGMALLCYLAATGTPQSRDALATLFWPEHVQADARTNLRRDLSRLRHDLGDGVLASSRERVALAPDGGLDSDVAAFEAALEKARTAAPGSALPDPLSAEGAAALREAAALYRDDFLAGFSLPSSPAFDAWQAEEAERLRAALAGALLALAHWHERAGEFGEAILHARRHLGLDPLDEHSLRTLMRLHALAGQPSAALRQYGAFAARLEAEFNLSPADETVALAEAVRDNRLAPATAAAPGAGRTDERSAGGHHERAGGGVADVTVGRSEEIARLRAALDRLERGRGGLVLIEGEAGIGKSRLVAEGLAEAGRRGLTSLSEKCYEAERAIPYQVVIDLVGQELARRSDDHLRTVPPAALAELTLLVPELADRFPDLPGRADGLAEARQARLFRALHALVSGPDGSGRGVVLAIDDIQWADDVTLRFLLHLAHHPGDRPILLILACRSEEAGADPHLAGVLYDLARSPGASRLVLERLSERDAASFLGAFADDPQAAELTRWLHAETDGHPFFLVSIVQSLLEQGVLRSGEGARIDLRALSVGEHDLALPDTLRASVVDRLRRLPEAARAALDTAAVLGRRFDFDTIAAVAEADERLAERLLDALETLVARRLLREGAAGFDFSHDKIREVAYEELSAARRALLHRRVAAALERLPGERAGSLAEHFEAGGVWDRAAHYLLEAAEGARALFAMRESLAYYDRTLALTRAHPDRHGIDLLRAHRGRGEARAEAGDFVGATDDLEIALDAADDPALRRELHVVLGMTYRRIDDYPAAGAQLDRALELARAAGDDHAVADILFHLGSVAWSRGDVPDAERLYHEAAELSEARGFRDRVLVQALHGQAEAAFLRGDLRLSKVRFHASLALAREIGDRGYEAENLYMLGGVHTELLGADLPYAERVLREALAISEEARLDWHRGPILFLLGYTIGLAGHYQEGLELVRRSGELARSIAAPYFRSIALDFAGVLYRELNLLERSEACHVEALELVRKTGAGNWLPCIQANLALDRLRRGDLSVGGDLEEALAYAERHGLDLHVALCREALAELALRRNEPEQALAHADALAALAGPCGMRERLLGARLWRGRALAARGRHADAAVALGEARALAEAIDRPRLTWTVHDALAELGERRGDAAAAAHHRAEVAAAVARIAAAIDDAALCSSLPGR